MFVQQRLKRLHGGDVLPVLRDHGKREGLGKLFWVKNQPDSGTAREIFRASIQRRVFKMNH